jgi:r-opsin
MIPACTCKAVACLDPWVYAINHPRYRQDAYRFIKYFKCVKKLSLCPRRVELQKKMPWFCIHEPEPPAESASSNVSETTKSP